MPWRGGGIHSDGGEDEDGGMLDRKTVGGGGSGMAGAGVVMWTGFYV